MFKHYLYLAVRHLSRFKTTSAISILSLALGLSCFIAALGTVVVLTTGDANVAAADRIFIVAEGLHPRGKQNFDLASLRSSMPLAEYLRLDFPQLEAVATARDVLDIPVAANEHLDYLPAAAVNSDFFTIFDFEFVGTPIANPLAGSGVVISEQAALRLFGTTLAVGRTITLQNAFDVTVTGVFKPLRPPSHIGATPDHLLRFEIALTEETNWLFQRARNPSLPPVSPLAGDSWGSPVAFTYVRLPHDGSLTGRTLAAQLDDFTKRRTGQSRNRNLGFKYTLVPLRSLGLAQLDTELFQGKGPSVASLILLLATVVLGIACVNYANLSVAQALVRERELGLRRVLGATRFRLAQQQWIESGLQFSIALGVALLAAPAAALYFDNEISLAAVANDIRFWVALGSVSIGAVFVLGLYSAFALARAEPVHALRGTNSFLGAGRAARFLAGLQFAAAGILVIGALVVADENRMLRASALHPASDPVVVLEFPGRDANIGFDRLKERLKQSPAIREVSGITRLPWSRKSSYTSFSSAPGGTLYNVLIDYVRFDFERVFDADLLAGRGFDPKFNDATWAPQNSKAGDVVPIIVERATARALGWANPAAAVDKIVYWPTLNGGDASMRIIGVLEDNPMRIDAAHGAQGHVYALLPGISSNVIVRIDKNRMMEALAAIDAAWRNLVPYAPVNRRFLDELFEREYRLLDRTNKIVSTLTIIGAGIALIGLFAMSAFVTQRRRREIGVRKTLGATTQQIVLLLLRDLSLPVLFANLLIWPIGFIAATKYLELFLQRVELTAWPFAISLGSALLLASLAVGGHAFRAANVKPADVLRCE